MTKESGRSEQEEVRSKQEAVSSLRKVRTYRDLLVWQKAMVLVTEVYQLTKAFPQEELYGLTSQIRRCAVSVPSNIAEGYAGNSDGDSTRFLRIACGSVYELQTQLEIAQNLDYLKRNRPETISRLSLEVEKMLSRLIGKISRNKEE